MRRTRNRRLPIVCLGLVALALVLSGLSLTTGSFPLSFAQISDVITGHARPIEATVLLEWRLPRLFAALVFGAALGIAGTIFQTLTRNPLGSPDVIGLSGGSYTGALIVGIVLGGGIGTTALGALAGGLLAATAIFIIASPRGGSGVRFIVVGIAVSTMLTSLNTYLLLTADRDTALAAAIWGAGTLNGIKGEHVGPAIGALACVLLAVSLLSRPLQQFQLGDDLARSLGVDTGRARFLLLALGVALTAIPTAVSGPITFIALVAPHIARALTRAPGPPLTAAAVTGAFVLLSADFAAQRIVPPLQLPVGAVTTALGGLYLFLLLAGRKRTG